MPTKRDIVMMTLQGKHVPYVPWSLSFTVEAADKLVAYYGAAELDAVLDNHFLDMGSVTGQFDDLGGCLYRDCFGVVWDRTVDKDIGVVKGCVLEWPPLEGCAFPDPRDPRSFNVMNERIARHGDLFKRFCIGFSLFERAWTLRGMENLLVDFVENPDFVEELLARIADYNIAQVCEALKYNIDCVYFGDDWGQQSGLIMGARLWRRFIKPQLARMYGAVKDAGKLVSIHSCGDVDELFDDLIEIGVDMFNPFQPEVMDVHSLLARYRGRLAFHGGLSTQRTLPYGSPGDVRAETQRLIEAGGAGGYVFSPAHAVEGDVPIENMTAMIDTLKSQPGYQAAIHR
ncbi:MAG: uroporphyrinogen-III decarboxylase-like protein [Candidatus Sumerlaeota bacterium]|nr:uroporphyrinogen-III decarboxylase-like protein [Candidatus Sumerlaeota bacterium]